MAWVACVASAAVVRETPSSKMHHVATIVGAKQKPCRNAIFRARYPSAKLPRSDEKPPASKTRSRRNTALPVKIQLSDLLSRFATSLASKNVDRLAGRTMPLQHLDGG